MAKCKKKLTVLWLCGAGLIFLVFIFQTIFGRYGEKVDEAWQWLLPTLMPTLFLIVGTWVVEALSKETKRKMIDKFVFRLSFILSIVYILLVAITIFLQPFAQLSALELMKKSNLWLGPFQGLVSASIGVFFVKGK